MSSTTGAPGHVVSDRRSRAQARRRRRDLRVFHRGLQHGLAAALLPPPGFDDEQVPKVETPAAIKENANEETRTVDKLDEVPYVVEEPFVQLQVVKQVPHAETQVAIQENAKEEIRTVESGKHVATPEVHTADKFVEVPHVADGPFAQSQVVKQVPMTEVQAITKDIEMDVEETPVEAPQVQISKVVKETAKVDEAVGDSVEVISHLLIRYLEQQSATDVEVQEIDLIIWYMEHIEDSIQTEDQLLEHQFLVQAIIETLLAESRIIEVRPALDPLRPEDRVFRSRPPSSPPSSSSYGPEIRYGHRA
eukprot:8980014-Pyramimonas_sp.AAC.1